jgi:caffeoyl-CoA O-methyltransferase
MQLVRSGGVIAIDNTLWSGAVADPNVRRCRHRGDPRAQRSPCTATSASRSSLLPLGDGLTLALKK